jgi:hypothetical protein
MSSSSSRFQGASGHVSSMRNMDVRRLWEKLHNSDFRDKCFTYYREATFDHLQGPSQTQQRRRQATGAKIPFMRRIALQSTEGKVALALATVLSIGIGVTRFLASSSQTTSADRVEAYVDSLRKDWDQYQSLIKKS